MVSTCYFMWLATLMIILCSADVSPKPPQCNMIPDNVTAIKTALRLTNIAAFLFTMPQISRRYYTLPGICSLRVSPCGTDLIMCHI